MTTPATRTHSWIPLEPTEDMERMSGAELLAAVIEGRIAPPPMAGTLGFALTGARPGFAEATGETGPHLANMRGTVHGGYVATLLDSVLGASVLTLLPPRTGISTVQLNVNYVRPVVVGSGLLRCSAEVVHQGRRLSTARARVVAVDSDKLYAHATATIAVSAHDFPC
ncbi:PaaI family thioesterase [Kitasatospora sp. NPDC085879]|uniref:PaaI family thioesterase n=1 Tax=Kitasatospora sp. NPDC085879 TaxID=3154769 RepID=UPI00341E9B9E